MQWRAETERPSYEVGQDLSLRCRPPGIKWVDLDLLDHGVLPDEMNMEIESRIDAAARDQQRAWVAARGKNSIWGEVLSEGR